MDFWINVFLVASLSFWSTWLLVEVFRDPRVEHGTHMLMMLGELETNPERMEYLRSDEHRRHKSRCDCGALALPFPSTTIIEDELTHTNGLCQPTREFIKHVVE